MLAGIYVHVPFCERRCGYCDFYVEIRGARIRERTVHAILREAELRAGEWGGVGFDSVFLGGGTPSYLGAERLSGLLVGLSHRLPILAGAEWTVEANPESLDPGLIDAAMQGGANRLSLGVQSFDDGELAVLGRLHNARAAGDAVRRARAAGFTNINIDLIYGLPGSEGTGKWERSLAEAIALSPDHISCYLLSLEPHVPMARAVGSGALPLPGDSHARRQYDAARRILAGAGYDQYEISNWAMPGRPCLHNLTVWRGGHYLGLGPGAHGYDGVMRRANNPDLAGYLSAVESGFDPPHSEESIDPATRREERLMLGLRLRDGLAWEELERDLGSDAVMRLRARALALTKERLLEDDGRRLRVSDRGIFVSNRLVAELISAL